MNSHELQERLIAFSASVIKITEKLQSTNAGKNLSNQLVRSSTSVSLNYGEAQSGESRKDFVHKI
jgi:four helix bundle protein